MKRNVIKLVVLGFLVLMAGTSLAFAEAQESGNAVVNSITSVLKMPIKMLDKASNSLDNSSRGSYPSEDVMVSDVYDIDAETTG